MEQPADVSTEAPTGSAPPVPTPLGPPDRVIGGVAGQLAARLGLDALWVRLGFVLLGLAGGIGVVVYAAWWLVLAAGAWSPVLRVVGGAALVLLVPWWVAKGPDAFVTGPVAVVLLLAGLALALWQPRRGAAPSTPTSLDPGVGGTWPAPSGAGTQPYGQHDGRPRATVRPARRAPRERSQLGRYVLGVAIALAATWALADQFDGGRLHPEQWLGAAAVVCGAGLLVGVVRGRARWLIVPALLAAGAGYVSGTMARVGIPAGDLTGDRYISVGEYTQQANFRERVGRGDIWINVDAAGAAPVHIDARVAFGDIHLTLSPDVTVDLRPRVDHGSVRGPGLATIAPGAPLRVGDGDVPDVIVDAWVGRGDIEVQTYDMAPYPSATTTPPMAATPDVALPDVAGELVAVRDGVAMTTDGWVVIGDAEAVISPDDEVTTTARDTGFPAGGVAVESSLPGTARSQVIETWRGPFTLLPRSLLVTPDGQVLDLQALRAEVSQTRSPAPASTAPAHEMSTTTIIATTTTPPTSAPLATIPGG